MAEFRYVDGSSLPRYFREGLFPLVRHAFAQTRRLCKSSNFDHHWVQVYSISAKIHGIKQKLKGDQYIQLDTDRFNEILDELTTWLHFDPAAQKQAAEHWADEHGTLGHEHPIADHLAAAQQFTATICEPAEHRSNLELLRQRHDSNAAEQWQDEQTERTSKRRRVDQGLIDLTEESEPEAEEDEGSEDDDETQAVICL